MRSSRTSVAAFRPGVIGAISATGVSRSMTTMRVPRRTTRRYRESWFLSSPMRTVLMLANFATLPSHAQLAPDGAISGAVALTG